MIEGNQLPSIGDGEGTPTKIDMQKELKRIHVLQAGLFLGIFYAALGLIFGLIYGLFMLLVGAAGAAGVAGSGGTGGPGAPGGPEMFALFGGMGLFMIILIPVMYGAMGFVVGIIASAFYNLIAKWVGGLKFDVANLGPTPQ